MKKRWRCTVCNQVFEGDEPPAPCPICGAGEEAFVLLDDVPTQWKCTVCGEVFDGDKPPAVCPVCGAGAGAFIRFSAEQTSFKLDTEEKFIIIGGGAAGLETAKAIRERNSTATITLICGEGVLPYNRPALSDVIGDGLSYLAIAIEDLSFYEEKRIDVITDASAVSIDRTAKRVALSDSRVLPYDKLALTVGANPFCPVKPVPEGIPVYTLRTFADARQIVEKAHKCKNALVVGGGILGIEAVAGLRERGVSSTIVEFAPRIMANQADDYVAAKMTRALERAGMRVITGASVEQVLGDGALLSSGEKITADFILVSAGIRPETTLARGCNLNINRGIVVDENMRTSDEFIYAAGDCAEAGGRVIGLWAVSLAQGQACGASMAGDHVKYTPGAPATVFEGMGMTLFSAGNLSGDKRSVFATVLDEHNGVYKKAVLTGGRVSGVLYYGESGNPAKALGAIGTADLNGALDLLKNG